MNGWDLCLIILKDDSIPNAAYTLKDSEAFRKDIGEEYGIEESRVKFGRRLSTPTRVSWTALTSRTIAILIYISIVCTHEFIY